MLCAHTVRRLKPGTFDDFAAAFLPTRDDGPPAGWVRFNLLRNGDEVVTFGFFDGTREELEASQQEGGYDERRASIDQYVDSVVANGIYEIVENWVPERVSS